MSDLMSLYYTKDTPRKETKKTVKKSSKKVYTKGLSDLSSLKTKSFILKRIAERAADAYRQEHIKTDRQILDEVPVTTEEIYNTCDIIFNIAIISMFVSLVSLAFALFVFINH